MRELSQSAMDAFFPQLEAIVSTGVTTPNGVTIQGRDYAGPPSIARGSFGSGQPAITMQVGRQQVILGYGGFHTP